MLLSHATVEECARAALAHEDPAADFDTLPEAVRRECLNYARHILSGGTPAEWHDMGIDRIALPGWTYGPEKNLTAKTAPYLARYTDLAADVREKREALADILRTAREAIKARHAAEKQAAEEAEAKAQWRLANPDEAAAEDARIEAERAEAERAARLAENPEEASSEPQADTPAEGSAVADDAIPTDVPPAPDAMVEPAPVEAPEPPKPVEVPATSRRSRR